MENRKKMFARIVAFVLLLLALALTSMPALAEKLSRGSKGEEVVALQEKLNEEGYSVGTADGDFGKKTEQALKDYQRDHGLAETGEVDDDTYAALFGEPEADKTLHGYEYYLGAYTWQEANDRAMAMGGRLANINSLAEYVEVQSELLELGYTDVAFWIGARRNGSIAESPEEFFWVDEFGGVFPTALDFDTLYDGISPWALGEPVYRDEDGTPRNYALMRFSGPEARWVWENTDGTAPDGVKMGYIVELENKPTRAVVPEGEAESLAPLLPMEEPAYTPTTSEEPYAILDAKLHGDRIYLKVNTIERCGLKWMIVSHDEQQKVQHYLIAESTAWVQANQMGGWLAFQIPSDQFKKLRDDVKRGNYKGGDTLFDTTHFKIWAQLWSVNDKNVLDEKLGYQFFSMVFTIDDILPESVAQAEISDPLYRVTPVLASDPILRDEGRAVEILNATDNTVVETAFTGGAVYLAPGVYIARAADSSAEDALFNVVDGPVMVALQDWETVDLEARLVDEETGHPIANTSVYLESQGREYETETDEDGNFSVANLPPVEAGVWSLGSGADFDIVGARVDVAAAAGNRALVTVHQGKEAAFFGYLFNGAEDWWDAYNAWAASAIGNGDVRWFIGHGFYLQVVEDIYDSGITGTIYDFGNNYPSMMREYLPEEAKSDIEGAFSFDFTGDMSELIVVRGHILPDRMKANNLHFNGWFEGWSEEIVDNSDDTLFMETPIRAYYILLLDSISRGENPLADSLFHAILKKRYLDSGLTKDETKEVLMTLNAAPDKYRDLYLLAFYHYNLIANHYDFAAEEAGEEGTNHYDTTTNSLWMRRSTLPENFVHTFFSRKWARYRDYQLGRRFL